MPQPKLSLHLNQKHAYIFFSPSLWDDPWTKCWPQKKVAGFEKSVRAVYCLHDGSKNLTCTKDRPQVNRRSQPPFALGTFVRPVRAVFHLPSWSMSQPSDQPHAIRLRLRVLHSSSLWNLLLKWEISKKSASGRNLNAIRFVLLVLSSIVEACSLFICLSFVSVSLFPLLLDTGRSVSICPYLLCQNHYLKVYLSTYPVTHLPFEESY